MAALSVDGTPMPALPNSADQINYENTTSGLSATTVKGAVDELASEKQDKSDNSLQTTDKTIVGGINELRSGLNNVWACDIYKYGAYIGTGGRYVDFGHYYIAKIPVEAGCTYRLVNVADNESTYNKFLDASDTQVGELVQNVYGGGITVTVPSGAVSMLVTMYVESGNPHVQIIS